MAAPTQRQSPHSSVRQLNSGSLCQQTGGTRSPTLCWRTFDLLTLAESNNITLRASHLAGKENLVADALSRGWNLDHKEWTMSQPWADHVFQMNGHPHVDLFATATNAHLPVFCTRHFHPKARAVDTLAQDWTGIMGYAFLHRTWFIVSSPN